MNQQAAQGTSVIVISFLVAMLLAVFPLPLWAAVARPEWVALVLIYWVVALPQRVGVLVAAAVGLVLDILEGAVLGQNGLSLAVVAFLSLILYQRVRVFNLWQQAGVVFILLVLNQVLAQWIQTITGSGARNLWFLFPALVGALLWPGVMGILRYLRRQYRVS